MHMGLFITCGRDGQGTAGVSASGVNPLPSPQTSHRPRVGALERERSSIPSGLALCLLKSDNVFRYGVKKVADMMIIYSLVLVR